MGPPSPGEPDRLNEIVLSGVAPGTVVTLYGGAALGSSQTDACELDLAAPTWVGDAIAGATGAVTLAFEIPAEESGTTVWLQAVESGCRTTGVMPQTWTVESWLGEWSPEVAELKFRGNHNDGVFGSRVTLDGDGDGDGKPDLAVSAPHEDAAGKLAGSIYLFYGLEAGEWVSDQDEALRLGGETAYDRAGVGLAFTGDLEGTGTQDLAVGAPFNSINGVLAGAAYFVMLPKTGDVPLDQADTILRGIGAFDEAGTVVARASDADGDGLEDVWVGAPGWNADAGASYLVPGVTRGTANLDEVAWVTVEGEAMEDRSGTSIAMVGDLDGDGSDDVAIGAAGSDRAGDASGAAYVWTQIEAGMANLADADAIVLGDGPANRLGATVVGLGDLDQDGLPELGVHVLGDGTNAPDAGALLVASAPLPAIAAMGDIARAKLLGEDTGGFAGAHAAGCDVDGDGWLDLAITAHESGPPGPQSGRVYLFYGAVPTGERSLGEADAVFAGREPLSNLGQDVSCADIDFDGRADLAVGAEADLNAFGGERAGSVYVLLGKDRGI